MVAVNSMPKHGKSRKACRVMLAGVKALAQTQLQLQAPTDRLIYCIRISFTVHTL